MNPLTKPVAISEMLILLSACAFLGYTIARIIINGKIKGLQAAIANKQADLADCRSTKVVAAPIMAAPVAAFAAPSVAVTPDDLKVVEGIGPKIEELFNKEGIFTFAQLAGTSADRLREILQAGGSRFAMWDPETWPAQAQLAADGKWDELKKWQDELNAGK